MPAWARNMEYIQAWMARLNGCFLKGGLFNETGAFMAAFPKVVQILRREAYSAFR
jgi:hypothetical protein